MDAAVRDMSALADSRERRIVPARSRIRLSDLLAQRELLGVLGIRDFKSKYKQSLLGPLWTVIQPLALLGAFALAIGHAPDGRYAGIPYILYTATGLCVWAYFQAAVTMGGSSLLTNHMLVRRTPCMRIGFPIASSLATLPTLIFTLAATLVLAALSGHLSLRVLLLPLGLVWLMTLVCAAAAATAAVTVRLRDMLNALPFMLQIGVFLAPVAYTRSHMSAPLRVLIDLNPVTGLIELWRWMILPVHGLDLVTVAVGLAVTGLVTFGAWVFFGRVEVTMADVI